MSDLVKLHRPTKFEVLSVIEMTEKTNPAAEIVRHVRFWSGQMVKKKAILAKLMNLLWGNGSFFL